jgi:hypothetical protein
MLITKRSSLTGNSHSREINVTQAQLDSWASGMFIQNAMPNLSTDDREFLMTGVTPEEWDKYIKNDEEYDINDIVCDECASPKGNICTCKVL